MIKKIYKKTIELAAHKKSKFFLAIISFIESFIFPIPPDVIIIPMTIAKKKDWFKNTSRIIINNKRLDCIMYLINFEFCKIFI